MNKYIVLVILLVSLIDTINAQTSIQINCGPNISTFSKPNNLAKGVEWIPRISFVGGLAINLYLSDNVFLSPGIQFLQKGIKSEWTSLISGNVTAILTNRYLEVPIHLNYKTTKSGSNLFLIFGPAVSYLMNSRVEAGLQNVGHVEADSKNDYKKYNITLDVGVSLKINVSDQLSIPFTVHYSYGITKISNLGSNEQTRDIRLTTGLAYFL